MLISATIVHLYWVLAVAIGLVAMDAPASLAQSFRPSLFKETIITGSAPTEILSR